MEVLMSRPGKFGTGENLVIFILHICNSPKSFAYLKMFHHRGLIIFCLSQLLTMSISAQSQLDGFEFFGDDGSIIKGKLSSDFKFFASNKMSTFYQPAVLTMYGENGDSLSLSVKIKARGDFRRQQCSFPPIRIKFKKDHFTNSTVKEYNKLKWVTHCQSGKGQSDKVIEEYLIYKAYSYLTEFSFRVRLMEIEYVDTGSKRSPGFYYAFLMEDIDQVAQRNEAMELNEKELHPELADRKISTIMPMAMYMIGFTDWSVTTMHNIKLIQIKNSTRQPIPIPYDFDYSGLIDPAYAAPPPEFLGIEDVTQRLYRGFCRVDSEWTDARKLFLQNEDNILNLWRNDTLLNSRVKNTDLQYLVKFFDIISDDKKFNRTIKAECRK